MYRVCWVLALVFAKLLQAQPAGSATSEVQTAAARLYIGFLSASQVCDLFDERDPDKKALHRQQFQAWQREQGLTQIEPRLRSIFSDSQLSQLRQTVFKNRDAMDKAVRSNPAATLEKALAGNTFQLRTQYAADYALVFGEGESGGRPAEASSATTALGGPAGTVHTVADLNSLLGAAMDRATGRPSDRLAAGVAELKRLGRINITGTTTPKSGRMLEFENRDFQERWALYLVRFENDNVDDAIATMKGQPVTASCVVDKVKTFIELTQCRLILNPSGLTPANVPLHASGLRRKKIDPEAFLTPVGQGLRPDEVDGVYLIQAWRGGVGGYLTYEAEPVLVLRNGLLFSDPKYAPAQFNARMSQQREPHKWGKVTVTGKDRARVVWLESPKGDDDTEYEMYMKATPGPPGLKLNGSYSYITGAGNLSVGGSTNVVSTNSYSFSGDGRFVHGSAAGASTPGVATASRSRDRAGTYRVDGWTIQLNYDDGKQEPLLFGSVDNLFDHIFIGTTMYLKKK